MSIETNPNPKPAKPNYLRELRAAEDKLANYTTLLGSANNDVKRLSKYANTLEDKLEKIRAIAGNWKNADSGDVVVKILAILDGEQK